MFEAVYGWFTLAQWLVLASVFISFTGAVAYIRDMIRGRSKPNLVTWGLWGFAPLIATGAALSADANAWATLRIFMSGFGPSLVFVAGMLLPQSYWKLSRCDFGCLAFSLIALWAWLGAGSPIYAILIAAIADLFASLPPSSRHGGSRRRKRFIRISSASSRPCSRYRSSRSGTSRTLHSRRICFS